MAERREERSGLPEDPRTANELLADAVVRRMLGLQRYAGGLDRRTRELLDAVEEDLRRAVRRRLRASTGLERPSDVARLRALLAEVRRIRGGAWDRVVRLWDRELRDLAVAEAKSVDEAVRVAAPTRLETTLPPIPTLRAVAAHHPFQGAVMSEWARRLRRSDLERIEGAIKVGLVQGESVRDISARVVGTTTAFGRDGVTQTARREAEAVVRTAVNSTTNEVRRLYFLANRDVLSRELFVATLDSRTTPICRSLDGEVFPLGEGPIPPLHWSCRSGRVPLLDAEAVGKRPFKAATERGLLREFAEREGFDAPAKRDGLPHGTKGAFDEFARRRVRELTGRVPAKVDYQTWLSRQSAEFQDDVLGPTRGKLFRRGGLDLDRFVDDRGRERTLAELAKVERRAFRAAGLDPEDF